MKPIARFTLWVAVAFTAIVAVVVTAVLLLFVGLGGEERRMMEKVLDERGPLLAFAAFLLLVACGGVLRWLSARFVAPLGDLAAQTRTVATANIEHRIAAAAGHDIIELAAAINRLGDAYRRQHDEMKLRIAEANAHVEEERNRLAALMSELSAGVLVCNPEGRILLFNEQARALFTPAAREGTPSPVGLGRSIFVFLERDQVGHALDKLRYGLDRGAESPVTMFFAATAADSLVRIRVAPFLARGGGIAGLVLTCEDVTRAFGQEAQRRSLLQALATRLRQPAANVRAAAENLTTFPEMSEAERARFADIIAVESMGLSETIDEALREYDEALTGGLSLEHMRLADLVNVARRRIDALPGLATREIVLSESLWVTVDSYALAQVLGVLAERLRDEHRVREVAFRAGARGGFVELDLAWSGEAIAADALARWESSPIQVGSEQTPLSIRQVLDRHGAELWQQAGSGEESALRFLIPLAAAAASKQRRKPEATGRPEYYDFDLFRIADTAKGLLAQRLAELSYTVFDTETTGVEPSAGDRIISVGAVRIVNSRLLKQEVYEQLVDPQRSVPRESVLIHGIKAQDLAGQPRLREVLPGFHRFCEDTVLVGHNAAFDMRFLELAETESGVRFTQPVLDTLLLSAVVHRNLRDHSLEAIAERLGVAVVGRHTALGDALLTADIFMKLLPLLAEQGVVTLGQALEASRETYYARLQY